MRLLHVSDRLSVRGGADVHLLGVLGALSARGHDVVFAVGRVDEGVGAPCEVALVPGLDAAHDLSGAVLAELERLAARADLIHIHNALAPEALAWAAARGAVATVQDHRSFCPGRGKLTLLGAPCTTPMAPAVCAGCFDEPVYAERIQRVTHARLEALRRMRAILVLSRYMQRELESLGVGPVHVVPPFVTDLDRSAVPSGPPCVLFVGRLVHAKGAADAPVIHHLAGLDLPLVFAGTGPLRRDLARDHEVLGWVARRALAGVYRRARAVLMPSRWQEPFGIVGLEALGLGIPVAAWQSGAVAEWHPGGELLVPWGDTAALARALVLAVSGAPPAVDRARFDEATLTDRLEGIYRA